MLRQWKCRSILECSIFLSVAGIIIIIRGAKVKTALYKIISTVMFDNLFGIHVAVLKFLFAPRSAFGDLCK